MEFDTKYFRPSLS